MQILVAGKRIWISKQGLIALSAKSPPPSPSPLHHHCHYDRHGCHHHDRHRQRHPYHLHDWHRHHQEELPTKWWGTAELGLRRCKIRPIIILIIIEIIIVTSIIIIINNQTPQRRDASPASQFCSQRVLSCGKSLLDLQTKKGFWDIFK